MHPDTSASPSQPTRRLPSARTAVTLSVPVLLAGVGTIVVLADDDASEPTATDPVSADAVELTSGEVAPQRAADDSDGEAATPAEVAALLLDDRSLDGTGNNLDLPTLGTAGQIYVRQAAANYAEGVGAITDDRPAERAISNRIFNDSNENLFSENGVTHWGFVWGQFIDHTIGLVDDSDDDLVIAFDPDDPLEEFTNDLGAISTVRSAAADGTGIDSTRQQINTVSSYIDGWAVYGGTDERLDWLREGSLDGDPTNNDATLLTDAAGYLPTVADRPGSEIPEMALMGRLFGDPSAAVVAGDERANENIALTAIHTLFVREHNRIVDALPDDLDEETKFGIARRVLAGLQQYITYQEFLPAMGVQLDDYEGYDPTVDPSIRNEFATVGYRAHSQIHGEFEAEIPVEQLTDDLVERLTRSGVEIEIEGDTAEIAVPLNVAFGNPGLLADIGLGNLLAGLASEAAYANDEQIDNQLRSVLFQIPGPDVENPLDCLDGSEIAGCFNGVNDLGALDVIRGYDHGMPAYNDLREAYGLERITSFTEITGESADQLPAGLDIDDPEILDFVSVDDGVRRSTVAARLAALFGSVDEVDAFTGMVSEAHVPGTEFGELQLAMWTHQFTALRDGDRFFYENDPALDAIADVYGIDHRRSLADLITANTEITPDDLPDGSVFLLDEEPADQPDPAIDGNDSNDGNDGSDRDPDDDRDRRGRRNRPQRERRA